jgi:hypothetical protein
MQTQLTKQLNQKRKKKEKQHFQTTISGLFLKHECNRILVGSSITGSNRTITLEKVFHHFLLLFNFSFVLFCYCYY